MSFRRQSDNGAGWQHPTELVSLTFFFGPVKVQGMEKSFCSYSAFELRKDQRGGACFTTHGRTAFEAADRDLLTESLGYLVTDRHVILGAFEGQPFGKRRNVLAATAAIIGLLSSLQDARPTGISMAKFPSRSLQGVADQYELKLSPSADLRRQAKGGIDRTQINWLAWVLTKSDSEDASSMLAAYQAWRLLKRTWVQSF